MPYPAFHAEPQPLEEFDAFKEEKIMNDRELLEKIRELKNQENNLMDQLNEANDKVEWLEHKISTSTQNVLGDILLGAILGAVIGFLVNLVASTGFWIPFAITLVAIVVVSHFITKANAKNFETDVAPIAPRIKAAYESALSALTQFQASDEYKTTIGTIPAKYMAPEVWIIIEDYFDTHRADTFKEAFNLFESESKMNELLNVQKEQLKKMAENNAMAAEMVEQNERMMKYQKAIKKSSKWTNFWAANDYLWKK